MNARMYRIQEETRLIEMITSGHASDMTIQEIQFMLKFYQSSMTDCQKAIQLLRNKVLSCQNRCLEIQSFLDRGQGTEAQRKNWRNTSIRDREKVMWHSHTIAQHENNLVVIQQRLELLQQTLVAKQRASAPVVAPEPVVEVVAPAVAPEPAVEAVASFVAPEPVVAVADPNDLTLHVQLMSGEVKTVLVDRRHPISDFADLFATAHGYRQTNRLVFLLPPQQPEEKYDDEVKEEIFWSHFDRRLGKSYQDLVGEQPSVHLFLLVQPLDDKEWPDKLALIRKMLLTEKRNIPTAEQIFDLYSTWILTLQTDYKNRYFRLKGFVDAHPDVFPPLSEQGFEESKQAMEVEAFREWYLRNERLRTGQHGRDYRPSAERNIERLLYRHALGHRLRIGSGAIEFYLSTMTRDELFAMGIRPEHIQPGKVHSYFAEWDSWIARAFPSH